MHTKRKTKKVVTQYPTAIYIEDDDDWRKKVEQYIKKFSGIEFRNFVSGASIEEVKRELNSVSGPTLIIIDLRLGKEQGNYKGFHWLLEELEEVVGGNASTAVFVISGHLHEGIKETLERRGISENHIYSKGTWAEDRKKFLYVLREATMNMDEIAFDNIIRGASGQNIDPYLLHTIKVLENEHSHDSSETLERKPKESIVLPMLVRAKTKSWKHDHIPDLRVLSQIDNIFSCIGSVGSITALEKDPAVIKVDASRPGSNADCIKSVPFVKADVVQNQLEEKGDHALVGIIDTGIDVLHTVFRDKKGKESRIISIWDQTDPSGPAPAGYGIGTEHTGDMINEYIQTKKLPQNLIPADDDHGTHVASIIAGRETNRFFGGIAPEAKIVIVIPDMQVNPMNPKSLGYSVSHLMALQYIKDIAEREDLPLVINVSQGMNAGAHDGTSTLENGFDAITGNGQTSGIVVVKSGGNERNTKRHAMLRMASNSSENLDWCSDNSPRSKDVIELWVRASDHFKFSLTNPDKEMTNWVGWSNPTVSGFFSNGNNYDITFTRYDRDNGDSRLLITITPGSALTIVEGVWSLYIESSLVKTAGQLHAWIERSNNSVPFFLNHVSQEITLSIPGTANHIITIGSVNASIPYRLAAYSSFGPTRDLRKKPDLAAPGENIGAAKSNSTDKIVSMSGTSMAAPHVSGAIALLLSRRSKQCRKNPDLQQFNAVQIQAALTQLSQNYNGEWHLGMGFGILDVQKFFRELGNV